MPRAHDHSFTPKRETKLLMGMAHRSRFDGFRIVDARDVLEFLAFFHPRFIAAVRSNPDAIKERSGELNLLEIGRNSEIDPRTLRASLLQIRAAFSHLR